MRRKQGMKRGWKSFAWVVYKCVYTYPWAIISQKELQALEDRLAKKSSGPGSRSHKRVKTESPFVSGEVIDLTWLWLESCITTHSSNGHRTTIQYLRSSTLNCLLTYPWTLSIISLKGLNWKLINMMIYNHLRRLHLCTAIWIVNYATLNKILVSKPLLSSS